MEFSPLSLDQCTCSIENGRVTISIGKIANYGDPGNISGTLSVELWALDRPYPGGNFGGIPLAGTTIGEMLGQHFLTDCRYDLIFQPPPAGAWHLTLMLREWADAGYITRDYVNFALPYVAGTRSTISGESDNVISVELADDEKGQPVPPKIEDGLRSAADAAFSERSPSSGEDQEFGQGISLNHASPKEIATTAGISNKVPEHIIAEKPIAFVDEPPRVKGTGGKLLQRVRRLFRL